MAGKKKVSVHILTSDFDPIFQFDKHLAAWLAFSELAVGVDRLRIPEEKFQMVIGRHDADWSPNPLLNTFLRSRYDAVLAAINDPKTASAVRLLPGLWDRIQFKGGAAEWIDPTTIAPILVGSLHQKLLIVDERIAYVSGINHVGVNRDNRAHTLLRDTKKWHDGSVRVTGEILDDIVNSAYATWNDQRIKAATFLDKANKAQPRLAIPARKTLDLVPASSAKPAKTSTKSKPKPAGPIPCQAWRTMSRKINSSDQPDTSVADIVEGHVNAIKQAEKFIYLENQYLRDGRIGQALIDKLTAAKDLNLIVVLPAVSEEMMGAADPISLTGVALQFEIIRQLEAFGNRFGAFGLFAPIAPPKKGEPFKDVIYVHNKVMIVDDVFATMGSANLNERGTKLDFELNLAWHSPKIVKALRASLWKEILGSGVDFSGWKPAVFAKSWGDLAAKNAARPPTKRKGFLMPLVNRQGANLPLVPNWLAQSGGSTTQGVIVG
ncbi:hypothetical protein KK137_04710 [Croceibacterium sp. LX-88]|uniref:Phospholipase D n=1 Tax=Croceibacterium selenioxidans TaxID=2838833 RepID=A0ABS5W1J1_9SPHN|nr:phospholipase D family protein [Croceibacterium selenioxidans]MBT2133628.1 hypothetical protein [Croceibacterium selenioxidans]